MVTSPPTRQQKSTEEHKFTNEIGVCVALLESLHNLKGKVIAADAMLTQRKIAQHVLNQEADFMFILKDNQKPLNEPVRYCFTELLRLKPEAEPDFRILTGDETDARRMAPKI